MNQGWHSYPELWHTNDSPLIATIIKQVAEQAGLNAEFVSPKAVRVYCTKDRWIVLLMEVARQIYRDDG